MALMRIKRVEGLKEHDPRALGQLLGLDRAPKIKTLRRKLARLAAHGRAAQFGRALAELRVRTRGHAMRFLYVDGHVRVYHGKRKIPKTHVARIRLAMPATTDYWVNDAEGDPLFVVTSEANRGLVAMLPVILDEVPELVGALSRHGGLRPRWLEPQAVREAARSRLRHPHLPQRALSSTSQETLLAPRGDHRRTQGPWVPRRASVRDRDRQATCSGVARRLSRRLHRGIEGRPARKRRARRRPCREERPRGTSGRLGAEELLKERY